MQFGQNQIFTEQSSVHKSKLPQYIVLSVVLLTIFVLFAIFYVNNTIYLLEEETGSHIGEVAEQGAELAKSLFAKEIKVLEVLSDSPMIQDDSLTITQKLERMAPEVERENYLRIGYVDAEGMAHTTDSYTFYVGDRDYYQAAMTGVSVVSQPMWDRTDSERQIVVYAVPVFKDEIPQTVLFATNESTSLAQALQISFFNGAGSSYIVDSNGLIIFAPNREEIGKNMIDMMAPYNTAEEIDTFQRALLVEQTKTLRLSFQDRDSYIGCSSISGVNDWSLLAVLPSAVVFNRSARIIQQTLLFVMVLIVIFLAIIAFITKNKKKNDQVLFHMAFIDPLTQIGNYHSFYTAGEKQLHNGGSKSYALYYFDIDNFKLINDTFGYTFGDDVLRYVATVLRSVFGEKSIYARLSNDYFGVLYDYHHEISEVTQKAEELCACFKNVRPDGQTNIDISLSMGIYLVKKEEKLDMNNMINRANIARYMVKKGQYKGRLAVFNEQMREQLTEENQMIQDMKVAIREKQFLVYYQPKVALQNYDVVGFEALIRWVHPEKGFMLPSAFIPVAEKSGLIVEIGRLVWTQVCSDLAEFREKGLHLYPISINLSRIELYQADLLQFITETMRKYQIPGDLLEIEMTESVILNDLPFTKHFIQELKKLGIKVAMDDFGTGYSSLSCLRTLPIDVLKLDKSFLDGMEDDEKSKNIAIYTIYLAKSLHLSVVSEGMEAKDQVEFLIAANCDVAQGFYFSRPLPKEKIMQFLESQQTGQPVSLWDLNEEKE